MVLDGIKSKIRVFYSKTDTLKYISHLDLIRTIDRFLRRSDLNIKITSGFSPHYEIAFSNPISLGIESGKECFDIVLLDNKLSLEEIKNKLNKTALYGLNILKVIKLNGMDDVPISKLDDICEYEADLGLQKEKCDKLLYSFKEKEIIISVQKKKGIKAININKYTLLIELKEFDNNWGIKFKLRKDENGGNISPFVFIKGFMGYNNCEELSINIRKVCE